MNIEELEKLAGEYEGAANMFAQQSKEYMDIANQNVGAANAVREIIKQMQPKTAKEKK